MKLNAGVNLSDNLLEMVKFCGDNLAGDGGVCFADFRQVLIARGEHFDNLWRKRGSPGIPGGFVFRAGI